MPAFKWRHVGNNIVITNRDYRMDAVVYHGAEGQRRASKIFILLEASLQ